MLEQASSPPHFSSRTYVNVIEPVSLRNTQSTLTYACNSITHIQHRVAKGFPILSRSDMPTNCPSAGLYALDPLFNVSDILQQRWESSPKEDRKRLEKCWGYNDCGDCHRSDGFCGWCALVSLALRLPMQTIVHSEFSMSNTVDSRKLVFLFLQTRSHAHSRFFRPCATSSSAPLVLSALSCAPAD
jgi:hypothetical protein